MMLGTGTVQELFQKDIRKSPSDSEEECERQVLSSRDLHTSYSLINFETEPLRDEDILLNASVLLKSEGSFPVGESDKEIRTRFGLETIVEEMHDQSDEAVVECRPDTEKSTSGLMYEEYEIDLRGETSEDLQRSEELQRLLALLSKPKNVPEAPVAPVPDTPIDGQKGGNILIETTTNRKVECTLKEVKNTKYFLKGGGRNGSGTKITEGVPNEGDYRSYEVKGLPNPAECPRIEQPCASYPKCPPRITSPSDTSTKPRRSKTKSGKKPPGSKKCSRLADKKRAGWMENLDLTSVGNAIFDRMKDIRMQLQSIPNPTSNWNLQQFIGETMLNAQNMRNAVASAAGIVITLMMIGSLFYKPPGLFDEIMYRFGRRRTPFQSFYDSILIMLHNIIR